MAWPGKAGIEGSAEGFAKREREEAILLVAESADTCRCGARRKCRRRHFGGARDQRGKRGVVEDDDHPRRIALALRSDLHECSQPHQLCATRDKHKQPQHVRRAAIRTDRGKWRKPHWPSCLATRLLTPVKGKKGVATAFVAIPNQLPISRLTNNRNRSCG